MHRAPPWVIRRRRRAPAVPVAPVAGLPGPVSGPWGARLRSPGPAPSPPLCPLSRTRAVVRGRRRYSGAVRLLAPVLAAASRRHPSRAPAARSSLGGPTDDGPTAPRLAMATQPAPAWLPDEVWSVKRARGASAPPVALSHHALYPTAADAGPNVTVQAALRHCQQKDPSRGAKRGPITRRLNRSQPR